MIKNPKFTAKRAKEIGIILWTKICDENSDYKVIRKSYLLEELYGDDIITGYEYALIDTYYNCPLCAYFRYEENDRTYMKDCHSCPLKSCKNGMSLYNKYSKYNQDGTTKNERLKYAKKILERIKSWKVVGTK